MVDYTPKELLERLNAANNDSDDNQELTLSILNDIDNKLLVVANPPYLDKSANQIRAQITGSLTTAGTVSTVTTVTGITNLDGYQGKLLTINNNTTAWAMACRARIT